MRVLKPEKDEKPRGRLSFLKPKRERGVEIKPKQGIVIGVFSCKGGVGKTTIVANIDVSLADRMKNDVLLVDANLSAPNLGLHFGEVNPKATIHDVLAGELQIGDAILECRGVQALLGSIAYCEDIQLVDLRETLSPVKDNYKIILVDSAPGIGKDVTTAMKACDEIIIVTNPDIPTIASTLKTFRAAERYKVPILGVVVNRVRDEPYELPTGEVKKALGWPIIASVPEDRKVRESTAAGTPVVKYDPNSAAAKKFVELGEYILKRVTKG